MDLDMSQLELLKEKGDINNFEMDHVNQEVVIYWTYLK